MMGAAPISASIAFHGAEREVNQCPAKWQRNALLVVRLKVVRCHRVCLLLVVAAGILGCNEPRYQQKTESQWRSELESGNPQTRRWAADALEAMKAASDETDHALAKALGDPVDAVSVAAARALALRPDARQLRDLILERLWAVASADGDARISALEALALDAYQHERSVLLLAEALRDSSAGVRAIAASSLRAFGKRAAPAVAALQAAEADTNALVRHEVRDALSAISGSRGH